MPRYSYKARLGTGETVQGIAEAASLPALAGRLADNGALIVSDREDQYQVPRIRGVPYFEIVGIYRQIASSLDAGLPLLETLEMLSSETRNVRLKSLLHFLRVQVSQGVQLSDAMRLMPNVFPAVHTAAIKAGEESGRMEQVLADMADQAEALSNMNRKFASSLVYPTVVAMFALGLLSTALLGVVPKFAVLFDDLGISEYPSITKLMFFIASHVLPVVVLVSLGALFLGMLILTQRKAASGKLWLDSWKLRVPLAGQIVEKAALARFSGTLGVLLDSGVELPRAIRLASEGAGNRTVEYLLKNVSAEIELGHTFSEALGNTRTLPPTLAWRMAVGEETGTMPDALLRMSKLYADQVDSLVTSVAGILEPLLIIFIGGGVAMLVLGMFLPIVSLIQNLSGGGL